MTKTPIIPHHPPTRGATTAELLLYMQYTTNPVTKSVYRNIIGNRIDEGRTANKL